MAQRQITSVKDPTRIVSFTGHRDLPWGRDTDCAACEPLRYQMERCIRNALSRRFTTFLVGMALGADTLFAESVLRMREAGHAAHLVAAIPSPTQDAHWAVSDRTKYRNLIASCEAIYIEDSCSAISFSTACLRRNGWMVNNASLLIAYYDGRKSGGTAYTVRYAHRLGREVVHLLA